MYQRVQETVLVQIERWEGKKQKYMVDYVNNMIHEFPEKLTGNVSSPANDNLFKVNKSERLTQMKAEAFHTFVAKGLFLSKRARPDILPTIAFLCTRVKEPTLQDWMKLSRF